MLEGMKVGRGYTGDAFLGGGNKKDALRVILLGDLIICGLWSMAEDKGVKAIILLNRGRKVLTFPYIGYGV